MAKIKGPSTPAETCADKLRFIVEGLFPKHDPTMWPATPYGNEEVGNAEARQTSNEELIVVVKALKLNKAPGPDGILNVALKVAALAYPDMVRKVMQKCLDERYPQ